MSHLIRKDILVLAKPRNILIVLFYSIFLGIFFEAPESSAVLIPLFLLMDLVNQEEKYRTHKFLISLPVKRSSVIASRYIEGLLFIPFGVALTLIVMLIYSAMAGEAIPVSPSGLWAAAALMIVLASVYFPVYFKYGKVAFYIILFSVVGVLAVIFYMDESSSVPEFLLRFYSAAMENKWIYGLAGSVIIMLVFYLSYRLSARIYQKKEF
ncbi:ABC-2 transporter permease [Bacillus infantis]|uniref:ABC-2 transporter permease n=1 Tax=Bacillus infantis TaxID=324767 RepID=UPI0020043DC5|nr:ABC-2 transporter permease [Bacillus infantis]MCK6207093.1 ABC-2 transporter permease [Bacillus infantis]